MSLMRWLLMSGRSTRDYSAPCNRTKPTDSPARIALSHAYSPCSHILHQASQSYLRSHWSISHPSALPLVGPGGHHSPGVTYIWYEPCAMAMFRFLVQPRQSWCWRRGEAKSGDVQRDLEGGRTLSGSEWSGTFMYLNTQLTQTAVQYFALFKLILKVQFYAKS